MGEVASSQCKQKQLSHSDRASVQSCWGNLFFVAITTVHIISAGNAECLEQCGPPLPEVPAPPPSYPLILDRDPVPEELVSVHLPPDNLHCAYINTYCIFIYIYTKISMASKTETKQLVSVILHPVCRPDLFLCCQSLSLDPGVGGLRVRLRLWRWRQRVLVRHVVTGGTGEAAPGEGGVPPCPVRAQICAGFPCIRGGEDEEEAAALQRPRSALSPVII